MKAMYIDAPGQVSIKDVEMVESAEAILVPTVEHSHILITRESRVTSSPLRLSRQMRTTRMASSRE